MSICMVHGDKYLAHRVQWYGFFPILLLLFLFGWFFDMSSLPHSAPGFRWSLTWLFMWLFMWLLEMDPFPHREQWYEVSQLWIFTWHFVWCVIVWFLLSTYPITFLWLRIICPFSTFSMLYCLLPSSQFSLSFILFSLYPDCNDLTEEINMVLSLASEVHTRTVLDVHMLCQSLFRRVCANALITWIHWQIHLL